MAATSDDSVFDDDDEEALHGLEDEDVEEEEEEGGVVGIDVPSRAREDSFTGLPWDEDYGSLQSSPATPSILRPSARRPQHNRSQTITQASYGIARTPTSYLEVPTGPSSIVRRPSEDTPLLKKTVSFSMLAQPQRPDASSPAKDADLIVEESVSGPPRRRLSSGSAMSGTKHHRGGQSTYGQTVSPRSVKISKGLGAHPAPFAAAVQLNRHPPWNWHVVGTPGVRVFRMDHRHIFDHSIWLCCMLYVSVLVIQQCSRHPDNRPPTAPM